MLITEDYRQQNAAMHAKGNYGISGGKWGGGVDSLMTAIGAVTLLDYGSGRGLLKKSLVELGRPAHTIVEYDPAVLGYDEVPDPADVVSCTDVLEHIEPECLEGVIEHIAHLAQKAAFLVVATRPAVKHLPDGRNAHLIIKPAWWWLREFTHYWQVNMLRERPGEFLCVCVPR